MPKAFPEEFRRDVVAVARKREATLTQIAKDFEAFLSQRDSCWFDSDSSWGLLAGCCW